jgi:hypothetical protein
VLARLHDAACGHRHRNALELSASRRAGSAKPATSSTMRLSSFLSVNSLTQPPCDPVARPKIGIGVK